MYVCMWIAHILAMIDEENYKTFYFQTLANIGKIFLK